MIERGLQLLDLPLDGLQRILMNLLQQFFGESLMKRGKFQLNHAFVREGQLVLWFRGENDLVGLETLFPGCQCLFRRGGLHQFPPAIRHIANLRPDPAAKTFRPGRGRKLLPDPVRRFVILGRVGGNARIVDQPGIVRRLRAQLTQHVARFGRLIFSHEPTRFPQVGAKRRNSQQSESGDDCRFHTADAF